MVFTEIFCNKKIDLKYRHKCATNIKLVGS